MPTSALHVARTGLEAQDARMRVIANNLANVGTTGFKRDRANFATLAYQDARVAGQQSRERDRLCHRPQPGHRRRRPVDHPDRHAGHARTPPATALDLALDGDGYFQVQLPGGQLGYTRAGNFTPLGRRPAGDQRRAIRCSRRSPCPKARSAIAIGDDGTVSATVAGQADAAELGQITIASFANPGGLQAHRRQLPAGDRRERRGAARRRRRGRARQHPAGDARRLERQHRRGAGRHDRVPARLRDQFQDDLGGRRDAPEREPDAVIALTPRLPASSLACALRSLAPLAAGACGATTPVPGFAAGTAARRARARAAANGGIFMPRRLRAALWRHARARGRRSADHPAGRAAPPPPRPVSSKSQKGGGVSITPPSAGPLSFLNPDALKASSNSSFKGQGNAAQTSTLDAHAVRHHRRSAAQRDRAGPRGKAHAAEPGRRMDPVFRDRPAGRHRRRTTASPSTRVADARIEYSGKGAVQRASRAGLARPRSSTSISPF